MKLQAMWAMRIAEETAAAALLASASAPPPQSPSASAAASASMSLAAPASLSGGGGGSGAPTAPAGSPPRSGGGGGGGGGPPAVVLRRTSFVQGSLNNDLQVCRLRAQRGGGGEGGKRRLSRSLPTPRRHHLQPDTALVDWANPPPSPSSSRVRCRVLQAKFAVFCHGRKPSLPFLPTLPIVICDYARYLNRVRVRFRCLHVLRGMSLHGAGLRLSTQQGGGGGSQGRRTFFVTPRRFKWYLPSPPPPHQTEVKPLTNVRDLQPHLEAINQAHRAAGLDMPALSPVDETAFEFAISNRGDLPPTLPERRAPLLPRYVVRMLELSVVSPDERVRRSCAFTVLSYMTFGRYGINHAMRVEDVNVEEDGAVKIWDRCPRTQISLKTFVLLPYRVWVPPEEMERRRREGIRRGSILAEEGAEGGGGGSAGGGGGRVLPPPLPPRARFPRTARHREISVRAMIRTLVATASRPDPDGNGPYDAPLFGATFAEREARPKPSDEAVWFGEAIKAAYAIAPGNFHFNSYSIRAGGGRGGARPR